MGDEIMRERNRLALVTAQACAALEPGAGISFDALAALVAGASEIVMACARSIVGGRHPAPDPETVRQIALAAGAFDEAGKALAYAAGRVEGLTDAN